jgi:copper resistance protein C
MKPVRLLIAIGLAAGCIAAQAHAMLDHAQPRVGSMVHGSPPEVKLWFTEPLEPAFSTVHVVDAQGRSVAAG